MKKKLLALCLALSMLAAMIVLPASADSVDYEGYLVLGEDLSDSQTSTVLSLMGISDTSSYSVSYTTHDEEEEYFGDYLSADVLGTKALSSILLIPQEEGSGIDITLYNISYCTEEMYQSALIDAGVSDVKVIVAGPVSLSGTCALVSAVKAYSLMTGEDIDDSVVDAAVNEIVTTGSVGEEIGDTDSATELIAALKQTVLEEDLTETQIGTALDKLAEEMGITISDGTRQEIIDLMMKLKNCDIDVDALREQASELYDKVKDTLNNVDLDEVTENVGGFFGSIISTIVNFFRGLFGG
ncbi:MAG: DUF1002 domain-containing protein [Oscillospiraceae bacterium]|nr:DUF1002 domain-containing protein [Oscillospiraceae bacterium]